MKLIAELIITIGSMVGCDLLLVTEFPHSTCIGSRILSVLPQHICAFFTPAFYTYSVPHSCILPEGRIDCTHAAVSMQNCQPRTRGRYLALTMMTTGV